MVGIVLGITLEVATEILEFQKDFSLPPPGRALQMSVFARKLTHIEGTIFFLSSLLYLVHTVRPAQTEKLLTERCRMIQ